MVANAVSHSRVGSPLVVVTSSAGGAAAAGAGTAIEQPETLADAVAYSNAHPEAETNGPNTITFASKVTGITLTAALPEITTAVDVYAPSARHVTIDGGGAAVGSSILIVTATDGMSDFEGLTLKNGDAGASSSQRGGAIAATGAIGIGDSTISGNTAAEGGGIYGSGAINVSQSTISGNHASVLAGGISAYGSSSALTLDDSTVSGNSAELAGGIAAIAGKATIDDSTIAGNSGTVAAYGAGITASSSLTISGSTIVGNTLPTGDSTVGAGLTFMGTTNHATIESTIIAGNSADSLPDVFDPTSGSISASFSLIGDATGSNITQDAAGNDLLGTSAAPINPKLSALGNHGGPTKTMVPLSGSPAVERGKQTASTDQRNLPRDVDFLNIKNAKGGDGTDIGAAEVQAPLVAHRKRTGNQRATLSTPSLHTATGSPNLPVKFSNAAIKSSKAAHARFVKVQLRVDHGVNRTSRSTSGAFDLNVAGKRAGTHTVYARFTYTERVHGHRRTVVTTVSAKFKIR